MGWGENYSTSKFSGEKRGSSKNSKRERSKPRAIMMRVLRVTVLFRPFMIHCKAAVLKSGILFQAILSHAFFEQEAGDSFCNSLADSHHAISLCWLFDA